MGCRVYHVLRDKMAPRAVHAHRQHAVLHLMRSVYVSEREYVCVCVTEREREREREKEREGDRERESQ